MVNQIIALLTEFINASYTNLKKKKLQNSIIFLLMILILCSIVRT